MTIVSPYFGGNVCKQNPSESSDTLRKLYYNGFMMIFMTQIKINILHYIRPLYCFSYHCSRPDRQIPYVLIFPLQSATKQTGRLKFDATLPKCY